MTPSALVLLMLGLAVLGAGYQSQAGWLYLMGAGTLGLLPAAWAIAAWQLWGVRAEPQPIATCFQGGLLTARLRVARRAPGRARGLLAFVGRPARMGALLPDACAPAPVAELSAGRPVEAELALPTARRGEFALPAITLLSAYPFGLVALARPVASAATYMVFPVGPRVTALPWLEGRGGLAGATETRSAPGLSVRGVRPYRAGDPARLIHARTSARLGAPHVKETEEEAGEALVLFLDLRAGVHTEATLEHMVTVAASIVAFGRASSRPVQLATQPEALPPDGGVWGLREWVFLARAAAVAPDAPCEGPRGAILLSPVAVPGWRDWARRFVCCPAAPGVGADATLVVPVGAAIAEALERQGAA